MADEKTQSTQEDESISIEKLLPRVTEVSEAIHQAIESNLVSDKDEQDDLDELCKVLEEIKLKLKAQDRLDVKKKDEDELLLPESKRKELHDLLPEIERTLQQRKQPKQRESSEHPAAVQSKKMLSAALGLGCTPFMNKLRPSSPSQQQQQKEVGEEVEEEEAVSLTLLVRLAKHVLEPEQYYEWTTSYVDESRIYGWDEEAGEVARSLVGPDDGDFRAAAITGIHGSGKTALAQKVFVHDLAKDHFPIRLWVCVGPPDSEDRFNLLYRMLDNLGLDTNKIEDVIVDGAQVVKDKREQEEKKIPEEKLNELRIQAANKAKNDVAGSEEAATTDRILKELIKKEVDDTDAVKASKYGVLLYILHVTLSKTGYLIVFDDIRVYSDWYSNLTLPPPSEGEWSDRLAYGLPKNTKHRNAVLVTCRKEDDARTMVRTGRVFRPPKLEVDNGWKLFEREYKKAKEDYKKKANNEKDEGAEDLLFKELGEMEENIVNKCLGLPVAIIEAAKGFACSGLQPLPSPEEAKPATKVDKIGTGSNNEIKTEEATEPADDKLPV